MRNTYFRIDCWSQFRQGQEKTCIKQWYTHFRKVSYLHPVFSFSPSSSLTWVLKDKILANDAFPPPMNRIQFTIGHPSPLWPCLPLVTSRFLYIIFIHCWNEDSQLFPFWSWSDTLASGLCSSSSPLGGTVWCSNISQDQHLLEPSHNSNIANCNCHSHRAYHMLTPFCWNKAILYNTVIIIL